MRRTGDQRRAAVHRCQQRLPELMGVADKGATGGERPAQAKGQTIEMVVNDRPVDPGRGGHGLSEQAINRGGLEFELPHGLGNALGRARRARGEEGDARLFCVHGRQARYAVFVRKHQRALAARHRAVRDDMVEGARHGRQRGRQGVRWEDGLRTVVREREPAHGRPIGVVARHQAAAATDRRQARCRRRDIGTKALQANDLPFARGDRPVGCTIAQQQAGKRSGSHRGCRGASVRRTSHSPAKRAPETRYDSRPVHSAHAPSLWDRARCAAMAALTTSHAAQISVTLRQ